MKKKMMRKMTIVSCMVLILCLALSACGGKDGEEENNSVIELEAVPLDRESESGTDAPGGDGTDSEGQDSASPEASTETSAEASADVSPEVSDSEPKDASPDAAASNGGDAAAAPEIRWEILRETRTDDAGEEIAFAEYPMFTVAGDGSAYKELSAALAAINAQYKSQNETLLDELQENAKDYRESIEPAGVFGQGTSAYVYRCDMNIVSIMVIRTVNMGGPHPNNYWDYYNLNAGTGENLELSQFLTMDETMVGTIIERLHENYPEVEFDDAVLKAEIPDIAARGEIGWYFYEGQINLAFQEGSFGFGHAVGSLEVTVPIE